MEETLQPKTGKFALNYGLLVGGLMVLFAVMLYIMDMHYQQNWTVTIVNYLILIIGTIVAISKFKKLNGNILSLTHALKIGLGIALIAAIISVIYALLLTYVIDPDLLDKSFELASQKLRETGKLTEEQIEQQMEMGRKFAWVGYPFILILNLFIGFIVSLITGAVMSNANRKQ
ncbi:DUF4199 domain-containing protein [Sinomicrobium sp. M5D2P17]